MHTHRHTYTHRHTHTGTHAEAHTETTQKHTGEEVDQPDDTCVPWPGDVFFGQRKSSSTNQSVYTD